ncbi:hypothetical protein [Aurantimonas coralicida]|uniref:hypothetical protein n=1 Tax=Aurantimonas coralicida TaxID=182270 RepID=UPI001E3D0168|nr:hypothetical protein [Aurantimonas coralicida]MCD1645219.1 hypothetical protein [Aurantimonas coralicida]
MGYFSNGTEGMMYEEDFCSKCLHGDGCPVWDAHMLKNYEECNKPDSILHMLIPRTEGGLGNGQCLMFIDETVLTPLQRAHRRSEQDRARQARSEAD